MKKFRPLLIGFVSVLWLLAVMGFYYFRHKPITPESTLPMVKFMWQVFSAIVVTAFAGGIGARFTPWLGQHPLTRLSLQAALGFGVLSVGVLGFGALVTTNRWVIVFLLVVLALLVRKSMMGWLQDWRGVLDVLREGGRFQNLLAIGTGVILLITLVTASAPPTAFDSLVYHLTLPQAYFEIGKIAYFPWLMYWGMPQLAEMTYLPAFALGGVEAAVIVSWFSGLLSITGLLGYGAQRFGPRVGWVAVASLLSGFTLASQLSWGYADWFTVLFGLAFFVSLDNYLSQADTRYLWLSALFAGIALSIKYTAGAVMLVGLGIVMLAGGKNKWVNMLRLGAAATLVSSPWWIKNLIATGNPFYPFFMPAGAMDATRLELYQNLPPFGGWAEAVFLPWQATITGVEGQPGFAASIGPLMLGFALLAWVNLAKRSTEARHTLKTSVFFGIGGLFVWASAGRLTELLIQSRLYFSFFGAFALLAGVGYDGVRRLKWPQLRFGRIVEIVILLVFALNVIQVGNEFLNGGAANVVVGLQTGDEYLTKKLGMHHFAMNAIDELPDGSRTLNLWEPRSFYCQPDCAPDETLDRWFRDFTQFETTDQILSAWRAAGFTHVMVHWVGAEFFREDIRFSDAGWAALDNFLTSFEVTLDLDSVYTIYALE